jgi:hypothetical protein
MADDPRLELVDVKRLVAELPDSAILGLAEGALSGRLCRVCGVLRAHLTFYEAARVLHAWHEFFAETPALDTLTGAWRNRATEEERHEHRRALGEWKSVSGTLSHARCSVIYAAAELELVQRTTPD